MGQKASAGESDAIHKLVCCFVESVNRRLLYHDLLSHEFKGSSQCTVPYMQHFALQTFEQFGALYLHNHGNKKYLARPGLEPKSLPPSSESQPSRMSHQDRQQQTILRGEHWKHIFQDINIQ